MRTLLVALLLALGAGVVGAGGAAAHQANLAVMALVELQPGRYAMRWENRPFLSGEKPVAPIWPAHCRAEAHVLTCGEGGLSGDVGFEGLGVSQSAAMLRIRSLAGHTQIVTLTPSQQTARIAPSYDAANWAGRAQIARAYLAIGIEHILIGVDHLLFVLGLIWIARTRWSLVKTITAFTVAHSVTLAAVAFGWIGVPEAFVNAMIALSIAFIGVEILRAERGQTTLTLRRPWLVAFGFGLLHGFGFANALLGLGLPPDAAPLALAAFNLGVEIGQLLFVGVVLALAWGWREMTAPLPRRPAPVAAYAIGGLASFWFVDRLVLLIGA